MSALDRSQSDVETQALRVHAQTAPLTQDDHELLDFDVGLPEGEDELRDVENEESYRNGEESGEGRGQNGTADNEFPAPPLPPPTITTSDTKTSPLPQPPRMAEIPRLGNHQHTLSSAFENTSPSPIVAGPTLTSEPARYDSLPSAGGEGVTTLSLASAAPPPHGSGDYQQHDGMESNGIGMDDPAAAAMRYKDMSLLPTRRQNVACDACRARKVKCVRMPMAEKCEHCRSKGTPCTSIYVTQVTSSRKGRTGKEPSFGASTTGFSLGTGIPMSGSGIVRGASGGLTLADMNGLGGGMDTIRAGHVDDVEHTGNGDWFRANKRARMTRDREEAQSSPSNAATSGFDLSNLLLYMFSPTPVRHAYFGYTDRVYNIHEEGWPLASTFEGAPSKAHLKLLAEGLRMDLATDLIETYFQICHIRSPLLDPDNFRRRFTNPSNPEGPPPPPIIAVILAWGAKFSEHPLIVADRQACSADLPGGRQRSRLAQMMACRAQEVLETHKVFRVPSLENLQAALMMVPLVGPGQYRFWHCVSVELCLALGYNNRTVVTKQIPAKERGPAGFAFWLTFWHDACAPALARDQPRMHDDDHDLEVSQFYESNVNSNPIGGLTQLQQWHSSITALSRACRVFARGLYLPKCERLGVPMSTIKVIVDSLQSWRTEFLVKVGVPTVWPESWDFVAAVTACSSDLTYHVLWVVLATTLDESGIYELRQIERGDAFGSTIELHQMRVEAEAMRQKINDEALHGALRISALASVLTANSYLRLDPNVLFHAIREGGRYLAKLGRKEVQACIAGLRQCGISFEEAFDDVDELQRIVEERQQGRQSAQQQSQLQQPHQLQAQQSQQQQQGMMVVHHNHSHQQHQQHDPSLISNSSNGGGGGHAGGRQSPTMSHRSSMPGNMSASPNGYSLSGMSNPPPSDFAFALANNPQITSDFQLPYQDNHQLFSYGDR